MGGFINSDSQPRYFFVGKKVKINLVLLAMGNKLYPNFKTRHLFVRRHLQVEMYTYFYICTLLQKEFRFTFPTLTRTNKEIDKITNNQRIYKQQANSFFNENGRGSENFLDSRVSNRGKNANFLSSDHDNGLVLIPTMFVINFFV